jgi:hypothetical protein
MWLKEALELLCYGYLFMLCYGCILKRGLSDGV